MNRAALGDILLSLATLPMMGEPIDQFEHAMQTASGALAGGADDDLVLACALHDIGRAKSIVARYPRLPHEIAGARFVEEIASERATWLVRAHVDAKRYLAFVDREHHLSAASANSLVVQGGAMEEPEARKFARHTWAGDAIALRRWDDAAKVRGGPATPLRELLGVYERCRRKAR